MDDSIRRRESFESVSISPPGSILSITESKVYRICLEVFGSSPPPLSPPLVLAVSSVERVDLRKIALEDDGGHGYKAANLLQLERLATKMGISVPSFILLSHEKVMDHIKKFYPEFESEYAGFVTILASEGSLSIRTRQMLAHISARVEEAFSGEHTLDTAELRSWIASRPADHLIVRSTGREDLDQVSNAGGNLSVPFVVKDIRAVSLNIGKVAASYFSEKSIAQRIASKDPSLLSDSCPFVPVLVQEAIGEPVSRETDLIPRSGVMFIKRGVSEISVGLGHNEGIVTSGVTTDTIRFTRDGEPRTTVRSKFTRFRGVEKEDGTIACEPCPCTGRIVEEPALSKGVTKQMQCIAAVLYDFYGKEMDIEFTVVGDQIYLLQARPLKAVEFTKEPSYLEASGDVIVGEMITDGGSFVRKIEREDQILICTTINEAYQKYTALSERDQGKVEAIVIQEKAPRTSHEAVFFIGQGLPILQIERKPAMEKPFYIDTQQGLIAKEGVEKPGYVCYPMPLAYSMETSTLVEAMHIQMYNRTWGRDNYIRSALQVLETRMGPRPIEKISSLKEIKEKIEIMKRGSVDEIMGAAASLIYLVWDQIHNKDITPKSRIELVMVLENLLHVLENDPISPKPMSLERLYTVRLVEACFFQEGKGIIGGFSFVRSLTDIKSQRTGSRELASPHTEETLQDIPFVKMKKLVLKEEVREAFGEMLTHLEEIPEGEKRVVKDLFLMIDSLGAGTEFVNVTVANLLKKYGLDTDPENIGRIRAFFSELSALSESLAEVLSAAKKMQEFVLEESSNSSLRADPDYVQKNIRKIRERITSIGFCEGESGIVNLFERSPPEGRLILIQAIRGVVECYDAVIKACTGSTRYVSTKSHAIDFIEFLYPYRMMTKIICEMSGSRLSDRDENYLFLIGIRGIAEAQAKKQFQVSLGFDVTEILQEDVEYGIKEPQPAVSLEEKFTLFHQTMLKNLEVMAVKSGFNKELLPDLLADFITLLTQDETVLENTKISSIRVDGNFLDIKLEIPLRQHGAVVNLRYNRLEKKMSMNLSIFGGNERNRWGIIRDLAYLLSERIPFKVKKDAVKPTSLHLYFSEAPLTEDVSKIEFLVLKGLLDASFTLSGFDSDSEDQISLLEIIPPELQDRELVEKELMRNPQGIEFVSEELQTEELISKILLIDGLALKKVALKWQRDPKMIKIALTQNPMALEFVPKELHTVETVLSAARVKRSSLAFTTFQIRAEVMHLLDEASSAPPKSKTKQKGLIIEDELQLPPGFKLPPLDETSFKGYPPPPPPPIKSQEDKSIYDDWD